MATAPRNGIISGLFCWLCFVFTTMLVNNSFAMRSPKLLAIDGGYWLLVLVLSGAVIAARQAGLLINGGGHPNAAVFTVAANLLDELREIRTICHCGQKATMVVRRDMEGRPITEGEQVSIEKSVYISLCRKHWEEAIGRWPAKGPST